MFSNVRYALVAAVMFTTAEVFPATASAQDPVKWTAASVSSHAGATTSIKLHGKIDAGWYIYSLTQPPGGPVMTRVTVPDSQSISLAGKAKALTAPTIKFDENFGMNVETHFQTVEFSVPLKIKDGLKTGTYTDTVSVRYQACNASLCLPPRTKKLQVALTVVKST